MLIFVGLVFVAVIVNIGFTLVILDEMRRYFK